MVFTYLYFFFFNDTATTEIYTLSLHDALPIFEEPPEDEAFVREEPDDDDLRVVPEDLRADDVPDDLRADDERDEDRKSTRLNSSHANISYAVFCLKKKKNTMTNVQSL